MVTRDGATTEEINDEEDTGRLLSALRFGCNAVFGENQNNALPTDSDIEVITDRGRTEGFSSGNLKGGMDSSAKDFDATKLPTETTSFGGIDFKKIREDIKERPKDMHHISAVWKKRQRKNRIKLVQAENTGWGSKAVPILAANDYDLETGERSVFAQELAGQGPKHSRKRMKSLQQFEWQEFCQVCGDDEGTLLRCPRCPVSLHLECAGVNNRKEFMCCSHHNCSVCGKNATDAGGLLFPCICCPNAFCDDHLPAEGVRFLDKCERMEKLGFDNDRYMYIHCTSKCEDIALEEFGWVPPEEGKTRERAPCPLPLDLSECFGGQIDGFVDVPDDLVVQGKRKRKNLNYATGRCGGVVRSPNSGSAKGSTSSQQQVMEVDDKKDANYGAASDLNPLNPSQMSDDDEVVFLGSTKPAHEPKSWVDPIAYQRTDSSNSQMSDDDEVVFMGSTKPDPIPSQLTDSSNSRAFSQPNKELMIL